MRTFTNTTFETTYRLADIERLMTDEGIRKLYAEEVVARYCGVIDTSPTSREAFWGINDIDPEFTYSWHFAKKLGAVADLLHRDSSSTRAVITIDAPINKAPCFSAFHLKVADGKLIVTCFARSLDLDLGLPVDATVFWTFLVIAAARMLSIPAEKCILKIISDGAHTYEMFGEQP